MRKGYIILSVFILLLTACGGEEQNATENGETKVMTIDQFNFRIKHLEAFLYSQTTLEKDSAEMIIALYNDFAAAYPEDKNAPVYLNKAADVAGAIQKPKIKVQNYKTILEKYPEWPGCDQARYLLAFTLDSDMDRREEAKKYYEEVVAVGKDTNFVRDSKYRLNTIDSMTYNQFVDFIVKSTEAEEVIQ